MAVEVLILLFFGLALIGVPIAYAIAGASIVYIMMTGTPWPMVGLRQAAPHVTDYRIRQPQKPRHDATADAAGQGATMIPAMKKSGYPAPISAVVTSASSVIGPIFPSTSPMS